MGDACLISPSMHYCLLENFPDTEELSSGFLKPKSMKEARKGKPLVVEFRFVVQRSIAQLEKCQRSKLGRITKATEVVLHLLQFME